jgi:TM2 domain-containing membrane protein YozV
MMLTMERCFKETIVDDQWFYAKNGQQNGPVTLSDLQMLASVGEITPTDYVWRTGMREWVTAKEVRAIFNPKPEKPIHEQFMDAVHNEIGVALGERPPLPERPSNSDLFARKIAAAVCAILFGSFGVPKFVLGLTRQGVIMFLVTVVGFIFTFGMSAFVMHIIGIIEGVIYLAKSDDDFYQDYIVNKRGWF